MLVEKYLTRPRHVELQVFCDNHGNGVYLAERDCSVQRRHQKVIEEAPAPGMTETLRSQMGDTAVKAAQAIDYRGAGTVEFLLDEDGSFYFMEMNTRIQVEHPVTEMITGIDLIAEQIRVAEGIQLSFTQEDINIRGHAIEPRINAEDPETFIPSPGRINDYHAPGGLRVRVDSAVYQGYSIPPYYDSMISKLIVYGRDRDECLMRLRRAIDEYVISGIKTTLPLHRKLAYNDDIIKGNYDIKWLESWLDASK